MDSLSKFEDKIFILCRLQQLKLFIHHTWRDGWKSAMNKTEAFHLRLIITRKCPGFDCPHEPRFHVVLSILGLAITAIFHPTHTADEEFLAHLSQTVMDWPNFAIGRRTCRILAIRQANWSYFCNIFKVRGPQLCYTLIFLQFALYP